MVASKYLKASQRTLTLLDHYVPTSITRTTISQIKQIQSHLTVTGTFRDPYAAGKLLSFYAVSDVSHAHSLFTRLPCRSTFIWNTMIKAFTEVDSFKAIGIFKEMVGRNFRPNNYALSFLFRNCVNLCDLRLGMVGHCQAIKFGWEFYDFIRNGLVHLYASCECMIEAVRLFDVCRSEVDVVTWTALINGFVKVGDLGNARRLFDEMPMRNDVSWSVMINGYVKFGLFQEGLELFNRMQVSGSKANQAALVGAVNACASLGGLDQGRWIHAYIKKNNVTLDKFLGGALVDMYAKCGCIEMACTLFEELQENDVYVYTNLISGLANHGQSTSAVKLFQRMESEGIMPNEITFICVLNACSQMGLMEEGLRIFESMSKNYGIEARVEHYGCLVDLLGRAGQLEQAQKVVREMPMEPDSYVLGALMNACRDHSNMNLGKETIETLASRNLDRYGTHVLLSNIHASANNWEQVLVVRKEMEDKKLKKVPGCSLIEVNGSVNEFAAGDTSHVLTEEIISLLFGINKHIMPFCVDDNRIDNSDESLEPTIL